MRMVTVNRFLNEAFKRGRTALKGSCSLQVFFYPAVKDLRGFNALVSCMPMHSGSRF